MSPIPFTAYFFVSLCCRPSASPSRGCGFDLFLEVRVSGLPGWTTMDAIRFGFFNKSFIGSSNEPVECMSAYAQLELGRAWLTIECNEARIRTNDPGGLVGRFVRHYCLSWTVLGGSMRDPLQRRGGSGLTLPNAGRMEQLICILPPRATTRVPPACRQSLLHAGTLPDVGVCTHTSWKINGRQLSA